MKRSKLFFIISICLCFVNIILLIRTIATSLVSYYNYEKYYLGYGVIAIIVASVHLAILIFCTIKAIMDIKRNNNISKLTIVILLITVISLAFWIIAVKYNEIVVYVRDVDDLISNIMNTENIINGQLELLKTSKYFSFLYYIFDLLLAGGNIVFSVLSTVYEFKENNQVVNSNIDEL